MDPMERRTVDHRIIDQRSLAFGHAIARKLAAQPQLIELARENIGRWLKTASATSLPALEEWRVALEGPLPDVLALLTGSDERSVRLRQSNPFAGALTEQERSAIILQFQSHDTASA